jgi:hypothetical protein
MAKPPRMTTKMPKPAPEKAVLRRAPLKPVKAILTRPPLKATPASAIDRANRSQAMEAREMRMMGAGAKKATSAAEAAIDRANRAQAMEAKEARMMRKKAPQVISTTVRERTTPPKKK